MRAAEEGVRATVAADCKRVGGWHAVCKQRYGPTQSVQAICTEVGVCADVESWRQVYV
jgi:hypothetical protein